MATGALPEGALAGALLRASDWLNDALLERLEADGWPRLGRNQSQVFLHLDADGTTPSELARRLGITRQSTQVLLRGLVDAGLLELTDHPEDRRALVARLTTRGRRLVRAAEAHLRSLERELEQRIGPRALAALRRGLAPDWGPRPATPPTP